MTDEANFRILIVDDEPNIRKGLAKGLSKEADEIELASNADEAIAEFRESPYELVIADMRLPSEMDGLQLVEQLLRIRPLTAAIVVTAHGTVEMAVEAMRLGAFDFITKPLDLDLIRQRVRKARAHHNLRMENQRLRNQLADVGEIGSIIGQSAAMQTVLKQVRQVAPTDATAMIQGESGAGKELVARALHNLSERREGPFVAINLGAIPETLLESELFGHERGSFTGAACRKQGCFEQAKGGTLFLDEISEIPSKCQVELLRVLETQRYMRVGGEELLTANVRILSATNKPIEDEIEEGNFREDLFYRLNVAPIHIPPLRQRRDDIPLLVEHFLKHLCHRHGRSDKIVASEAMQQLITFRWPGNVRQLRNVVERLVVTVSENEILLKDIPTDVNTGGNQSAAATTLAEAVEETEKITIEGALTACNFHREKSAKLLGISVRTLHYKMNRYDLH